MRKSVYLLLCALFLCFSAVQVNAQWPSGTPYGDPRTPQGTLRAFAGALTKADLTKAASYLADASSNADLADMQQTIQKIHARYSIDRLQIATNDDTATISFLFVFESAHDKSTNPSWAVLRRNQDNLWEIDATRTLGVADNINPFSDFLSAMSSQPFPGEARADIGMQGSKFLQLGRLLQSFVANNGDKFALQNSQLRGSLSRHYPTIDILLRPSKGQEAKVSFNAHLTNVPLRKVRFPQRTVMLYQGENGQLDFADNGRAAVTFVDGHVQLISAERAKTLLLWTP